ncbi:type II secretion system F family protein [Mariniblastus sp.]|nr:type II secretion system F family protein [Mariniblastus sp.]
MDMIGNIGSVLIGVSAFGFASAILGDHGRSKAADTRRLWENCEFFRFFYVWIEDLKKILQPKIKTRTSIWANLLRVQNTNLHLRRGEKNDSWDVDSWIARELFRSLLKGCSIGVLVLLFLPVHMAVFVGLMLSFLFYFLGQLQLAQRSKLWHTQFHQRLSFSVDLIALTMKAGSTIDQSLQAVLDENRNHPIGDEFGLIVQQHQNGTPLLECFDNFRKRMRDKDVNEVVFTAINAERYGSANADTYLRLADQMRIRRSQRAEKCIGEAKTMMALPNFMFLLSGALAIVGPFGLKMWQGLQDFF